MTLYCLSLVLLIIFMVITGIAVAGEQILHSKIKTISPDKVDGQYCYVKIEIVQVELLMRGEKGFIDRVVISSIMCSI